jgi:hypothetical protein
MGIRKSGRAFLAGVLAANSLPHLATAAAGRAHLTPLAGRASNRWVNLAWGAVNLGAGLALVATHPHSDQLRDPARDQTWDERLLAFDAGAASFAVWMAVSEKAFKLNWKPAGP